MNAFHLILLSCVWSSSGFILDQVDQAVHRHICYGDLGCFNTNPPFRSVERPVVLLPASPDSIQTKFELHTSNIPAAPAYGVFISQLIRYFRACDDCNDFCVRGKLLTYQINGTRTRPSTAEEEILDYNNASSINASSFDGSRLTKIIVHGFTHNGHRQWIQNMVQAFLKKDDMNVIVVDWGHGAGPPYTQATANTRVVGAQIAKLINLIVSSDLSSMTKFHIIGHSLGAHIAGYAGERLTHLPRISGLDPAGPYFQGTDAKVRLDPSDADFVDAIHTDDSGILALGFGASQAMGHVDFYPNNGQQQPGCPADLFAKLKATVWTTVTQLDVLAGEAQVACSHERSYAYYTESILSTCPFMGYPCTSGDEFAKGHCFDSGNDYPRMGYYADQSSARGAMYLTTQDASPYCNYHYQLNITGKNNMDGKLTVVLQGTKGNSDAISLMTDNEVHTQGHIISKFVTSPKDIGTVTAVAIRYDKTTSLLTGWAYPETWELLGVSLLQAESHTRSQFCAYGKGVLNHNAVSMGVTGTC